MIDLAETWGWLRRHRGEAEEAALTLPDTITRNPELFADFALPARIQLQNDEARGRMFELHPRPDVASPKSWAWILAVRSGTMQDMVRLRNDALSVFCWWRSKNRGALLAALDAALDALSAIMAGQKKVSDLTVAEARLVLGCLLEDEAMVERSRNELVESLMSQQADCPDMQAFGAATGAERGEAFSVASEMLRGWHADISHAARMESLGGREIHDLVAVSADFTKVLGRFLAYSKVLGYPQHPEMEDRPVRLYRDLRGFIAGLCSGALLIGAPDENYRWMAACKGGIVTDDVAHGKSVKKILTRPYAGPQVLVAG